MAEEEFEIDVYGDEHGANEHADGDDSHTYDGEVSHDANGNANRDYQCQDQDQNPPCALRLAGGGPGECRLVIVGDHRYRPWHHLCGPDLDPDPGSPGCLRRCRRCCRARFERRMGK